VDHGGGGGRNKIRGTARRAVHRVPGFTLEMVAPLLALLDEALHDLARADGLPRTGAGAGREREAPL